MVRDRTNHNLMLCGNVYILFALNANWIAKSKRLARPCLWLEIDKKTRLTLNIVVTCEYKMKIEIKFIEGTIVEKEVMSSFN